MAIQNLDTLGPNQWNDISVINCYLLLVWSKATHPHARYFDCTEIRDLEERSKEHKAMFRKTFQLPLEGACPMETLTTTVNLCGVHHFTMVVDLGNHAIHILGRFWEPDQINNTALWNWREFDGPGILRLILWLHDWDEPDLSTIHFNWQSWTQTVGDCGPIAAMVQEQIIMKGIKTNLDSNGPLVQLVHPSCAHGIRMNMFQLLQESIFQGYTQYQTMTNCPESWKDAEDFIPQQYWDELKGGQLLMHSHTFKSLQQAAASCKFCTQTAWKGGALGVKKVRFLPRVTAPSLQTTPLDDLTKPKESSSRRALRKLISSINETRGARLRGSEPGANPTQDDEGDGMEEGEEPFDVNIEADTSRPRTIHGPRVTAPSWIYRANARHPLSLSPPMLPLLRPDRFIPHSPIDDYTNGPVLEDMIAIPRTHFLDFIEYLTIWSPWTTFRDYGYRLLASFHQIFYKQMPGKQLLYSYILRQGLETYNPDGVMDISGPLRDVDAQGLTWHDNTEECGIEDLFAIESNANNPLANIEMYVCGRVPDNLDRLLRLNLEMDDMATESLSFEITMDIDSIIWIGRRLHIKGVANVYLVPWIGKTAPIRKNNSAYVELLLPQSLEDKESSPRTEWYQRRTPLSTIPHTHFIQITSEVSKRYMNGYIFFPRMQHRHEYTGFWAANIPYAVQYVFWNEVLLVALAKATGMEVSGTYMPPDVDYQKYKTRTKTHKQGDLGKAPTAPMQDDEFDRLQMYMRNIVRENPDRYGIYDSFFIVLEAKGVKAATRTLCQENPFTKLERVFPSVDFEFLQDRLKGELIMDIGINIQPAQKHGVVGLWRIEPLVASYESSGFTAGVTHHTCLLGRYGGMQAEMKQERSRFTHILKRISYNLEYEVTRPASNEPTVIADHELFHLSKTFDEYCDKRAEQYRKAKGKSYGVRDETRMGGGAAIKLCMSGSVIKAKVCTCFNLITCTTNILSQL